MATRDKLNATIYIGNDSAGNERLRATIEFSDGKIKRPTLIPQGMTFDDLEAIAHNLYVAARTYNEPTINMRHTGCDTIEEFNNFVTLWYQIDLLEQTRTGTEVTLKLSRAGRMIVDMIKNQEYTELK